MDNDRLQSVRASTPRTPVKGSIPECCLKGHLALIVVEGTYRSEYAYCGDQWKYWRSWVEVGRGE